MVEKQKEEKKDIYTKFTYNFDNSDTLSSKYGIRPYIISNTDPEKRYENKWTSLREINENLVGQTIKIRVRLQRSRIKGKGGFLVFREGIYTCQGCLFVEPEKISSQMIEFISAIPHESIIDVDSVVSKVQKPIESCNIKDYELQIQRLFLVTACVNVLPFQIEDANRKTEKGDEEKVEETITTDVKVEVPKEEKGGKNKEKKGKEKEKVNVLVRSETRFDNRVLDLRVLATNSIMKLQSGAAKLFRDFLYNHDFVEIHTPKLIKGASEGGTNVFKLMYFDEEACLAQSPQLYKQMAIIGGLEKVFEIAPVFRAENSNTTRHLCEFTMLDIEMAFKEHYFEVIDVIYDMFCYIFDGLKTEYKHELNVVANQYPFELIEYSKKPLRLSFHEGVKLLQDKGFKQKVDEDLDTVNEKKLGELVKEKYGTDFYFLYGYPKSARPFYTMRLPGDDNFTNSYDAFIRGEEVLSGAQRIHDYEQLYKNVIDAKINPKTLEDYLNAFKLGAPPHGGCGIGLERIVKLFTGFGNVKRCCMFPRDPKRLSP